MISLLKPLLFNCIIMLFPFLFREKANSHLWTLNTHEVLDDVILDISSYPFDGNLIFDMSDKLVFLGLIKRQVSKIFPINSIWSLYIVSN